MYYAEIAGVKESIQPHPDRSCDLITRSLGVAIRARETAVFRDDGDQMMGLYRTTLMRREG